MYEAFEQKYRGLSLEEIEEAMSKAVFGPEDAVTGEELWYLARLHAEKSREAGADRDVDVDGAWQRFLRAYEAVSGEPWAGDGDKTCDCKAAGNGL